MLELLHCEYISQLVRFEVLTAVIMKDTVFWNVTPCSLVEVYQRSGGAYCVPLQGWIISQESKQQGDRAYAWFILSWRWRQYILLKHW
jgi:hypothetical protein